MAQPGKKAQSSQGRALESLDLSSRLDGSLCSTSALLWTVNTTGLSTVDAETLGAFLYNFGQIDVG
ncbi:hypothetical protein BTUL_0041g00030 [Botrytis tulipae]|uniref:Uncharacterized protein n=1 Tax=Botrytis tulipae TaxID=87230 RepID=A0A4Z1EV73_9HELO|nr:hypothetical protein BTUL_0041g00030 [Botrytis tulipae]